MKKLLLILLLVSAAGAHAAPAPTLIPFQGRLTDQTGTAYTNGQYTLIFTLYDQAVGGNVLWTETHQKVGVVHGMVNVFLGSINANLVTNDFSQTRHLGITIDADNNPLTPDPEMVPRQMIIPAFHAKKAEDSTKLAGSDWSALLVSGNNPNTGLIRGNKLQAQGITADQIANGAVTATQLANRTVTASQIATGGITTNELAAAVLELLVPPGSIMAFGGDTNRIPSGWLLCDGQAMSGSTYPRLFAAISTNWGSGYTYNGTTWSITNAAHNFNLPDLRGYFLRGVDGGVGRDPDTAFRGTNTFLGSVGNKVGSTQGDAFKSHTHGITPGRIDQIVRGLTGGPYSIPGGGNVSANNLWDFSITATGGSETRPKNAYVHYLIKY
jgi:Phage Tail Collar Domain